MCKIFPTGMENCTESEFSLFGHYLYFWLFFVFFVFNLDAQGFQKLQVLVADLEFRVGTEGGDKRSLIGRVFALLADANGGLKYKENVVAAFFNAGNDFGDLFGVGKRFVDGFPEFFHELFQLLIHESPWNRTPLMGDITRKCDGARVYCTPGRC